MPEGWPLFHCLRPLSGAQELLKNLETSRSNQQMKWNNYFFPLLLCPLCCTAYTRDWYTISYSSTQVSCLLVFRSHLKVASLIIRPISRCPSFFFKRARFSQFSAHPSSSPGADSNLYVSFINKHVQTFGRNTGSSAGSGPQIGRNDSTKSDVNLREAAQRAYWRCGEFYRMFDITLPGVLKMKTF